MAQTKYKSINSKVQGLLEDIKLIMREKNGPFNQTCEEQLLDELALILLDPKVKVIKQI